MVTEKLLEIVSYCEDIPLKESSIDGDERLWLEVLKRSIRDWYEWKISPSDTTWQKAKDIPEWLTNKTSSFYLILDILQTTYDIDPTSFKNKLIECLGINDDNKVSMGNSVSKSCNEQIQLQDKSGGLPDNEKEREHCMEHLQNLPALTEVLPKM